MEKLSRTTRIYEAIKAEVMSGAFPPGRPIHAATLSRKLACSINPVREALCRLAAERLVQAHDHEGFYAPRISESSLRDLYDWQIALLRMALEQQAKPHQRWAAKVDLDPTPPLLVKIERLFAHLADKTHGHELQWAIHNSIDRLHVVKLVKEDVADGWEAPCHEVLKCWRRGDPQSFTDALIHYHRHRLALVPDLVEMLNTR